MGPQRFSVNTDILEDPEVLPGFALEMGVLFRGL